MTKEVQANGINYLRRPKFKTDCIAICQKCGTIHMIQKGNYVQSCAECSMYHLDYYTLSKNTSMPSWKDGLDDPRRREQEKIQELKELGEKVEWSIKTGAEWVEIEVEEHEILNFSISNTDVNTLEELYEIAHETNDLSPLEEEEQK